MLRWLLDKIMRWGWDFNRELRRVPEVVPEKVFGIGNDPDVRINMHKAINGTVLEIISFRTDKHGQLCNSVNEMFIVAEGDSLHDAIATVLLTKGTK